MDCLRAGVDHVFEDGVGLLHMACIAQNFAAVQCLMAAGVDTNIRDVHGWNTFLHSCVLFSNISCSNNKNSIIAIYKVPQCGMIHYKGT